MLHPWVSIPHRIEKNAQRERDEAEAKLFPSLIGLRKTNLNIVFQGYHIIKAFFCSQ